MRRTAEARFWANVRVVDVADSNACWEWQAPTNPNGYGIFYSPDTGGLAHRFAYWLMSGPLDGSPLDHTCHSADKSCPGGRRCPHRRCVNPDHLEPVTPKENTRRGRGHGSETHCAKGHPFDEANTTHVNGHRFCRTCKRDWEVLRKERLRQEGRIPPRRQPAQCGTVAGYKRHWRQGESACVECKEAQNTYSREWKRNARKERNGQASS